MPRNDEAGQSSRRSTLLGAILNQLPVGVYVMMNGEQIFFNQTFCQLVGYTRKEIQERGLLDLLKMTPHGENFARDIFNQIHAGKLNEFLWDNPLCRPDGSEVILRCLIRMVDLEGQDAIMIILRDITKRRKAENEALIQSERFTLICENSSDFIYVHDDQQKISYISPAIEKITGYKPEEWQQQTSTALCPGSRLENAKKATDLALETGEKQPPYLVDFIGRDGRYGVMEINETPYKRGDRVAGLMGVARDITDRLEAEEKLKRMYKEIEIHNSKLQRANREMEAFIYTVSHDLKAPIVTLQGMTERLIRKVHDDLDEKSQHYLERIKVNIERLEELVLDLLELSRIGRIEDAKEKFDAVVVLKEALEESGEATKSAEMKVVHPECLGQVWFSPKRLRQVFTNLITNAAKYCATDRLASLTITSERDDNFLNVSFTDNGRGIDPKFHKKIFEAFQRPGSRKDDEGSGIGLTIVKRIVEYNGGSIWVESREGEGSVFTVSLPMEKLHRKIVDERQEKESK
jgi:PAS domain S-box-containing protein